jgi:N-formylglutamate deformylase
MSTSAFHIERPDGGDNPIVAHVPHSSTFIPQDVRVGILLDGPALTAELVRLTDWHTDEIYAWTSDLGAARLANRISRLVVDPERFADDAHEPMARVGQGAVYVRTTDGRPLRGVPSAQEREELLDRFFHPYHQALTDLVGATLDRFDRCLLLDCHSFSSMPLPSEPDQEPNRPDFCIGSDPFHTPPRLVELLSGALRALGYSVEVNRPFTGALVPLAWYGRDPRVAALMIETRRGLYCDESTGERAQGLGRVAADMRCAVSEALRAAGWMQPAVR